MDPHLQMDNSGEGEGGQPAQGQPTAPITGSEDGGDQSYLVPLLDQSNANMSFKVQSNEGDKSMGAPTQQSELSTRKKQRKSVIFQLGANQSKLSNQTPLNLEERGVALAHQNSTHRKSRSRGLHYASRLSNGSKKSRQDRVSRIADPKASPMLNNGDLANIYSREENAASRRHARVLSNDGQPSKRGGRAESLGSKDAAKVRMDEVAIGGQQRELEALEINLQNSADDANQCSSAKKASTRQGISQARGSVASRQSDYIRLHDAEPRSQQIDQSEATEARHKTKQSVARDVMKLKSRNQGDEKRCTKISNRSLSPISSVRNSQRKRRLDLEASMPGGNNAATFQREKEDQEGSNLKESLDSGKRSHPQENQSSQLAVTQSNLHDSVYYPADEAPQGNLKYLDSRRNSEQRSNDDGLRHTMQASRRSDFISPSNSAAHAKMNSSARKIAKDLANGVRNSQNSLSSKFRNAFPKQKQRQLRLKRAPSKSDDSTESILPLQNSFDHSLNADTIQNHNNYLRTQQSRTKLVMASMSLTQSLTASPQARSYAKLIKLYGPQQASRFMTKGINMAQQKIKSDRKEAHKLKRNAKGKNSGAPAKNHPLQASQKPLTLTEKPKLKINQKQLRQSLAPGSLPEQLLRPAQPMKIVTRERIAGNGATDQDILKESFARLPNIKLDEAIQQEMQQAVPILNGPRGQFGIMGTAKVFNSRAQRKVDVPEALPKPSQSRYEDSVSGSKSPARVEAAISVMTPESHYNTLKKPSFNEYNDNNFTNKINMVIQGHPQADQDLNAASTDFAKQGSLHSQVGAVNRRSMMLQTDFVLSEKDDEACTRVQHSLDPQKPELLQPKKFTLNKIFENALHQSSGGSVDDDREEKANQFQQYQQNDQVQDAGNSATFQFTVSNKSTNFKKRGTSTTLSPAGAHDIGKKARGAPKTQKQSPEPAGAYDPKQSKVPVSRHVTAKKASPKLGSPDGTQNNLSNSLNIQSYQAQIEQKKLDEAVLRQGQHVVRGLKSKRSNQLKKTSKKLSIIKDIEGKVSQDDSNRGVQVESLPSNISSQNEQDLHILHVKLDSKLPDRESKDAHEEVLESQSRESQQEEAAAGFGRLETLNLDLAKNQSFYMDSLLKSQNQQQPKRKSPCNHSERVTPAKPDEDFPRSKLLPYGTAVDQCGSTLAGITPVAFLRKNEVSVEDLKLSARSDKRMAGQGPNQNEKGPQARIQSQNDLKDKLSEYLRDIGSSKLNASGEQHGSNETNDDAEQSVQNGWDSRTRRSQLEKKKAKKQQSPPAIHPTQGQLLFKNPQAVSVSNSDLYGDVISSHYATLPNERDVLGSHLNQTNYVLNCKQNEQESPQDYKSKGLLPTIEIKKKVSKNSLAPQQQLAQQSPQIQKILSPSRLMPPVTTKQRYFNNKIHSVNMSVDATNIPSVFVNTPPNKMRIEIPKKEAGDEVDPREYQEFSSLLKTLSPKSSDPNEPLNMTDGEVVMQQCQGQGSSQHGARRKQPGLPRLRPGAFARNTFGGGFNNMQRQSGRGDGRHAAVVAGQQKHEKVKLEVGRLIEKGVLISPPKSKLQLNCASIYLPDKEKQRTSAAKRKERQPRRNVNMHTLAAEDALKQLKLSEEQNSETHCSQEVKTVAQSPRRLYDQVFQPTRWERNDRSPNQKSRKRMGFRRGGVKNEEKSTSPKRDESSTTKQSDKLLNQEEGLDLQQESQLLSSDGGRPRQNTKESNSVSYLDQSGPLGVKLQSALNAAAVAQDGEAKVAGEQATKREEHLLVDERSLQKNSDSAKNVPLEEGDFDIALTDHADTKRGSDLLSKQPTTIHSGSKKMQRELFQKDYVHHADNQSLNTQTKLETLQTSHDRVMSNDNIKEQSTLLLRMLPPLKPTGISPRYNKQIRSSVFRDQKKVERVRKMQMASQIKSVEQQQMSSTLNHWRKSNFSATEHRNTQTTNHVKFKIDLNRTEDMMLGLNESSNSIEVKCEPADVNNSTLSINEKDVSCADPATDGMADSHMRWSKSIASWKRAARQKRLSRSKRLLQEKEQEKTATLRDILEESLLAKSGKRSLLDGSGTRIQLLFSNSQEDPQTKYVKRFRLNDKMHLFKDTLISQYGQNYESPHLFDNGKQHSRHAGHYYNSKLLDTNRRVSLQNQYWQWQCEQNWGYPHRDPGQIISQSTSRSLEGEATHPARSKNGSQVYVGGQLQKNLKNRGIGTTTLSEEELRTATQGQEMAGDLPTPQRQQASEMANCGLSNGHRRRSSKNVLDAPNAPLATGFDHLRFINEINSNLQSNQQLSTIQDIFNPSGPTTQDPSEHPLFANDSPKPPMLNFLLPKQEMVLKEDATVSSKTSKKQPLSPGLVAPFAATVNIVFPTPTMMTHAATAVTKQKELRNRNLSLRLHDEELRHLRHHAHGPQLDLNCLVSGPPPMTQSQMKHSLRPRPPVAKKLSYDKCTVGNSNGGEHVASLGSHVY